MKLSKQKIVSAVILSMLASTSMVVNAQEAKKEELPAYKGTTFDKVKKSGKILVSYRHNSTPLSYLVNGKPSGFAFDLCTEIAKKLPAKLGMPVEIEYVRAELNDRDPFLHAGKVDMECSTTIDTTERRLKSDFSIPYLVSGIRILKKLGTPYYTLDDLAGKKVALHKGNKFPIDTVKAASDSRRLNIQMVLVDGYKEAMDAVVNGQADAFVLNDLLLYGQRFDSPNPNDYVVTGPLLSIEPLGIMLRKNDPTFSDFVNAEMAKMMKSGRFDELYNKWMLQPIPPHNIAIGIPQSDLLRDVVRMPLDVSGH